MATKINKKRILLLLNLKKEQCHWIKDLNDLNWNYIETHTYNDAKSKLDQHDIGVAIAIISSHYQKQVFEAIMEINGIKPQLKWIAISYDNNFVKYSLPHRHPHLFFDYHHLPIDWTRLKHTLGHAHGMSQIGLTDSGSDTNNQSLLGKTKTISRLKSTLKKIAAFDTTVLINGETGTGKGLCARWIHEQSTRKNGPFITVNCGALPTNLIHSELFGYDKGAFTGAGRTYIGRIERAHKGTLFLDEIGDLSLESQIHLLHFLDDHTIERLGGNQRRTIDCRILFATHVDLQAAVEKGSFREDLYHRLNILHVRIPSLRDYKGDIELLSKAFIKSYSPGNTPMALAPSALEAMLDYDWPGNVRELRNCIQRAIIMASSNIITEQDLGLKQNSPAILCNHVQNNIDVNNLVKLINRNNYNISASARELNISRTTLYRLIKKYNIDLHSNINTSSRS